MLRIVAVILVFLPVSFSFHYLPSGLRSNSIDRSGFKGPPPNFRLGCISSGENETSENSANRNENLAESGNDNPIVRQWKILSEETRSDIASTAISFSIALLLVVDKISHFTRGYQRRDVVVFNPSETYIELTGNTEALIKRVVAYAGDVVEVQNGKLYVNQVEQVEPYINEDPDYTLEPLTVPSGMLLVLGDNRNHSFDSHIWGFLPEKNIIGRAVFKYWPPWRAGIIEGST